MRSSYARRAAVAVLAVACAAGPALGQITGFGGFATPNGTATVLSPTSLQLTADTGSQAGSAFFATAQAITNFTVSFTYTPTYAGSPADGVTFLLHNDAAGTSALGASGGAMGYLGIQNAAAIMLNLYSDGGGVGVSPGTRFSQSGGGGEYNQQAYYGPSGNLAQSGVPTAVSLAYSGGQLRATVGGVSRTYAVNLQSVVGGTTALVGFTGGTGGLTAQQVVSGFTFTPGAAAAASARGWRVQQSFLSGANTANSNGGTVGNQLENTQEAVDLANGTGGFAAAHRTTPEIVPTINGFQNGGWPVNGNNSDFAVKYSGYAKNVVGTSGTYTLYANSDDGFRLTKNGVLVGEFAGLTGNSNVTMPNVTINDGDFLEFYFNERGGGDFAVLKLNDTNGAFIGDTASGVEIYVTPVPEPATLGLLAAGAVALAARRRARAAVAA